MSICAHAVRRLASDAVRSTQKRTDQLDSSEERPGRTLADCLLVYCNVRLLRSPAGIQIHSAQCVEQTAVPAEHKLSCVQQGAIHSVLRRDF